MEFWKLIFWCVIDALDDDDDVDELEEHADSDDEEWRARISRRCDTWLTQIPPLSYQ